MTQLQAFGPSVRNPFDAELGQDVRARYMADPYERVFIDEYTGRPTILEPKGAFYKAVGARAIEGSRVLEQMPGFSRIFLSGPTDYLFRAVGNELRESTVFPSPFIGQSEDGWMVMMPEDVKNGFSQRPAREVSIQDLWNSFDTLYKRMMLQNGYSPETLRGIQITTAEDFAQKWPALLEGIRGRQWLQSTAEQMPIRSAISIPAEILMQIGTDPTFIISAGAAAGYKAAAKRSLVRMAATGNAETAAAALARITGKDYAKQIANLISEGPSQIVGRQAIEQGRSFVGRGIIQGGATATGATYGATFGYAQQLHDLEMAQRDPSEGLDFPTREVVQGGILGLAFSQLGLWSINQSLGPMTHKSMIEDSGVYGLQKEISRRVIESSPKRAEELVDVEQMAAIDSIETYIGVLYTPDRAARLRGVAGDLANAKIEDSATAKTLRDYMLNHPTADELESFMKVAEGDSVSGLQRAVDSGDIPETRASKVRKELHAAQEAELAAIRNNDKAAVKAARRRFVAAQEEYNDIYKNEIRLSAVGVEGNPVGLVEAMRKVSSNVPIATFEKASDQVKAVRELLRNPIVRENYNTTSVVPFIMDTKLAKAGDLFIGGARLRRDLASEDEQVRMVSQMFNLVDSKSYGQSEYLRYSNGERFISGRERWDEADTKYINPIVNLNYAMEKGASDQKIIELRINTMRAMGGLEDAIPETMNLANFNRGMLDDIGQIGRESGTFKQLLPDYVPTYTAKITTPAQVKTYANRYYRTLMKRFGNKNLSDDVNFNMLAHLGWVKKQGDRHVFIKGIPDDFSSRLDPETGEMLIPRKVSEINEKYRDGYFNGLESGLRLEAEWATANKARRTKDYDPDAPDDAQTSYVGNNPNAKSINNFVRSDMNRRIEQEVSLSREVLESGFIETNPVEYMPAYLRGIGETVFLDQAASEFAGQPLQWKTIFRAMEEEVKGNKRATENLKILDNIRKSNVGKLRSASEGAATAYVISNIMSGSVTGGLTPKIAVGVEGTFTAAQGLTNFRQYPLMIGKMKSALKAAIDNQYAKSKGYEHALDDHAGRWIADMDSHINEDARQSKLAVGSHVYSTVMRTVALERPISNFLRDWQHSSKYASLWSYRNKLAKWADADLQQIVTDKKTAKKIARENGFRNFADYRELKDSGLLDKDMLNIAEKIHELDPEALGYQARLRNLIPKLEEADAVNARLLDERLHRMALEHTQDIIATPTGATRAVASGAFGESPWMHLAASMSTYATTFQAATTNRLGSSAYNTQAAFTALFVAGEIFAMMYNDVINNGYSVDEAAAKWEDHPVEMTSNLILRMPVWGAFNPITNLMGIAAGGYGAGSAALLDSPALNFADRSIRAAWGAAGQIARGEKPTDAQVRQLKRVAPPTNLWWIRGTERVLEGLESER